MLHYYIYYRIQTHLAAATESSIQCIRSEIKTRLGIDGRLLKKQDDPLLWMEIYENVPEQIAFEEVLRSAEIKAGIASVLHPDGKRHIECFLD